MNPYRAYMRKAAKIHPYSFPGAGAGLGAYMLRHQMTPDHEFDPAVAAWSTAAGGLAGHATGRMANAGVFKAVKNLAKAGIV